MERLGRCHVLIVLLVILIIEIDESEEVSIVVEDRDAITGTTATVDVDNPADCDKVFLIIVTGSGSFNYVINSGNTDGAFTTDTDPDSGDEKLQCNMATITTNAITPYSLSITITDTDDASTATKTVTVTVENLVIQSANCTQVPSVLNGSIVGGDQSPYVEGQNVTYECTSGYTITGTATISCNGSGVWSEPPSCLKDCVQVPIVLNAEIAGGSQSSYVEGQIVTYNCTNGFTMTGTPNISCNETGAWTESPSCQRDIGSSCSSDTDCQITLHTPPYVCDNSMCKFGAGGNNCTAIANSCLANGQCSSDACECVDGFDPVDNKCYELIMSNPRNGSVIEICETTEINEVFANLSAIFAPTSTEFVYRLIDPTNSFTIADDTISVASDLDVDGEASVTSYVIVIELSHPVSSRTVSTTITISVEDDNDNAPEFGNSSYTFDISEQSTDSTVVGTLAANDKDKTSPNNQIANYTVFGTSDFEITSEGGLSVSSGASLNYTTTPSYSFLVMATDGGEGDMKMSTNVSVIVNIKPDIGSFCSSDQNCTGILSFDPPFVCDNSECKLGVGGKNCTSRSGSCLTNGQCTSDTCECVEGFNAVDLDNKCYELGIQSPSDGDVVEICESVGRGEIIANLSASLGPISTGFVYTINTTSFQVTGNTITIATDLDVDVDSPVTSYGLSLEVSHPNSSRNVTVTLTITVGDDNDNAPVFGMDSYSFDISEKTTANAILGNLSATDIDYSSPNNVVNAYKVIGAAEFEITAEGVLSVSSGTTFDYTTTRNYTFVVMATDGGLDSQEMSTNVSVTVNIETEPEFQAPTQVEILENIDSSKSVYRFTVTDEDNSGDLAFALVTQDPRFVVEDGVLKTSTSVNSSTFDVDPEGAPESVELTVNVTDGKYSDDLVFTLNIKDVNDNSPKFSQTTYNTTVYEKASTGDFILTLIIMDDDRSQAFNNIAAYIPGAFNVPFEMLNFDIVVKSEESLNYTSTINYTFEVVATDGSGTDRNSATATVLVTVESGPRLSELYVAKTVEIYENATVGTTVFEVLAIDPDNLPSPPTLSYAVVERSSNAFTLDGNNLTIGETLDADTMQSHTVVFSVSDGKYTTQSSKLTIHILDVNDNSPEFSEGSYSMEIEENHDIGTEVLTVTAEDKDVTTQFKTVTYTIAAGDDQGVFAIDASTGEITLMLEPLLQAYTLTVSATDGGQPPNSANVTAMVTVSDGEVNECDSNPCGDNAQTCLPLLNNFSCVCKRGWNGELCNTNIDDCVGIVCGNDGDCVDGINSFKCNCSHGWEGANCTNACGGNMYGRNCEHTCNCNASYLADPVATQTCNISTGHCLCAATWTGMDCSLDVDECTISASVCDSTKKEVCENSIGSFNCVCERGYSRTVDTAVCTKDTTPPPFTTNSSQYVVPVSVKITPNASKGCTDDDLKVPSKYKIVESKAKQMLSKSAPTGKNFIITDIRCGSYIIDAIIAIDNNNADKASLSVELEDLREGRNVIFGNEALQLDEITIGDRNLTQTSTSGTYNEKLCEVFTTISQCPSGQICVVENGSPRCRDEIKDNLPLILGLGLGVVLPLLLVLIAIAIVMYSRSQKRDRRPKDIYVPWQESFPATNLNGLSRVSSSHMSRRNEGSGGRRKLPRYDMSQSEEFPYSPYGPYDNAGFSKSMPALMDRYEMKSLHMKTLPR
ncbi:fat-like cadherin-related tumor suppressor homolog [Mya arenaria]|uniref:fat-like cadherin-related tumor suppressor homolog n=1 Tax=Mya arenaria TaxID=6604 RepID=UPI0022DF6002|nr:fat-like cadherin-related tumor suppressor homolog [Mya arenaria]